MTAVVDAGAPDEASPAASLPVAAPLRRPADPAVRFRWLLLAAVAVGLLLRVGIGLTDDAATTDETAYLRSGLSWANGEGFQRDGHPELHFPPFLPFLLGTASHLVDDPHDGAVALTALSGAALIVPLSLLARRIGGRTAGIATAWLAALAPGLATMPQLRGTGSEAEYTLAVMSAVWLTVSASDRAGRARLARLAAAGLLAGLAYLTRPEGLFVSVPLALAVAYMALRRPKDGEEPQPALVPTVAAFAVPLLLCVAPYAWYLHANTGRWELTAKTQDASIEAWHAVAKGDRESRNRVLYGLDETGLTFSAEYSSLPSLAAESPRRYAGIIGTNVDKLREVVQDHTVLPTALVLLAAAGVWLARRSRPAWLVLAVSLVPVASALAFFVQHRYLIVAVAGAVVFAGVAVAAIPRRWCVGVLAVALVLAGFASVTTFRGSAAGWWHPAEQSEQRLAGEWLDANVEPTDRIMTRSMIVSFYAERTTVAMPHTGVEGMLTFARHYGVRWVVADQYTVDRLIPELVPLFERDDISGLRLVQVVEAENRVARIFAVDPAPPPSPDDPPLLGFTGDAS
ncbi:MAG TPA: glycosyltransferase family 39 protein [Acidimicrobiales bacterium]|nr:glycosyltransferase family 39 protein [Acidimicrobiales bacterium]